jgi:hypothetical protein
MALLLSTGCAVAAEGVLDDAACQAAWSNAGGEKDIAADKAQPYVVKMTLVDVNGDGRITDVEWKRGCAAGLILATAREMDKPG